MNVLRLSCVSCLLVFALAFRGEAFQDKGVEDPKVKASQDKKPDDKKPDDKKEPKKAKIPFLSVAEAGPDFLIQGEYKGTIRPLNNDRPQKSPFAAQVVAKGDGKFEVYLLTGGLPGDGWDTKGRVKVAAKTEEGKTTFKSKDWEGTIGDGKLSGKGPDGAFTMDRVERQSPTAEAKPPAGAIVLFDGSSAKEWRDGKIVEDKLLWRGCTSKKAFATGKLHVEFLLPFQPKRSGQGRGNSGVYVQDEEIQVLDSFGLEGKANECGAFYGHAKPAVNMCYPPLTWQTYNVDIKADDKGQTVATVLFNGVKVHENFVIRKQGPTPHTIYLQDHGDPVVFRNIWFVESK